MSAETRSSPPAERAVVGRLKVMYGEQPPNDPTTLALVRLSLSRLRQQAVAAQWSGEGWRDRG